MAYLSYGRIGDNHKETYFGESQSYDLINGSYALSSTSGTYSTLINKDTQQELNSVQLIQKML